MFVHYQFFFVEINNNLKSQQYDKIFKQNYNQFLVFLYTCSNLVQ